MIDQPQTDQLQGFRSFELDLPAALLEQLVTVLDGMEQGALRLQETQAIPNAQGVYQLFHSGKLVYIGKTDAGAGLRQRLSRHAWTIQSRHNLDVEEMSFKAVEVLVFSAMDLETALLDHYKKKKQYPAWNGSGFGSNDPGRRRDSTALKADGFDARYPINIDLSLPIISVGCSSALQVLAEMIPHVPYTLRYEKTAEALDELTNTKVTLTAEDVQTVRSAIQTVFGALPSGWQATRLPGRIIIYRESVDSYPGGEIIARSG